MTSAFRARLVLAALLCCAGCDLGGNSGSETTNGLAGVARDADGLPVMGARVLALPEDYDPAGGGSAPHSAVTDAEGRYAIRGVAPGRYHVEFIDSVRDGYSLIRDVVVAAGGGAAKADGILGRPGGLIARVADFIDAGDSGYVYVPGTTAWGRLDKAARASGRVAVERVPAGRYPRLILVVGAPEKRSVTLARDFEVTPDSVAALAPFQTWKFSRPIALDTRAMGVAEDVAGFPLLVRLDSGGFDFSQARPDGGDLRFSRPDGTPAPFQIERWDAAARRAEIWVHVDTARGDAREEAIVMHWGRDSAGMPGGPPVFDAASGFATVYHLGEEAGSGPGGYRDATPNANHATAAPGDGGSRIPGAIGAAKAFTGVPGSAAGTLAAAMPPGFGGNISFTVSFWMRFDPGPNRQAILDFGAYDSTQKAAHWLIRPDTTAQFGGYDHESVGRETAPWQNVFGLHQAVGGWAHIATVYDAGRSALMTYVNGVRADSLGVPAMAVDKAGGLRIGKALSIDITPPESPLNGALDEVRFMTRAATPARIRLDYLTQRP